MNDNYPRPILTYYDEELKHTVKRYARGVSGLTETLDEEVDEH